ATVTYAGLAPGTVGLYQINVVIPAGVSSGAAALTFSLNGTAGGQKLYLAVGEGGALPLRTLLRTGHLLFFRVTGPPPASPLTFTVRLISSPFVVPSLRIFTSPLPPLKTTVNESLSPSTVPF